MLSKPTDTQVVGDRTPRDASRIRTPMASRSLCAMTAVAVVRQRGLATDVAPSIDGGNGPTRRAVIRRFLAAALIPAQRRAPSHDSGGPARNSTSRWPSDARCSMIWRVPDSWSGSRW